MKRTGSVLPCFAALALYAALILQLAACATRDARSLRIDTRNVLALQYMPAEISAMLDGLGYRVIPDPDPAHSAERYGEYRLQFQAREAPHLMIDAQIRMAGNDTVLHLYSTDKQVSRTVTARRFRQLQKRAEMRFGAENVSSGKRFPGW